MLSTHGVRQVRRVGLALAAPIEVNCLTDLF